MTRPLVLFLLLLSVPSLAGSVVRLTDLAIGPLTTENARFMAQPWSIALHAAGLSVFLLLLPLQLLARGGPRHRMLGRIAIVAGITGALAGVWMTLTYPTTPDSPAELYGLRLVIGTALAGFLLQAALAARARDIATHRAAITRATAIALGAGTAAVIVGLTLALGGELTPRVNIFAQTIGWALNLAVAEYLLARRAPQGQPA
jgi:uncharacterized membrane protein